MVEFIVLSVIIFLNGFFSMSEVALISARRPRLLSLAKQGRKSARQALDLMDRPDTFLSTVQIAITVLSILTGIYSGEALADDFALLLQSWGLSVVAAPLFAKTSIVIVATYVQCALGELFPKRLALSKAESMAMLSAPIITLCAWFIKPFSWLLKENTDFLMRLFRLKADDKRVTEEEVKSTIRESTVSGEVQEVEQDIMERALVLGDLRVGAIMTHRNDLEIFTIHMTADDVRQVMAGNTHNIYPVMDDSKEDIMGYVTLKDLVFKLHEPDFDLRTLIRKPLYFPETMTVYRALEKLKEAQVGRAMVCDEYGSLQGIISFKDIFEGLVGTLPDVSEVPDIIERADKVSWVVSGQCLFYDFLDYFDKEELYTSEFKTIGGLLLGELGRIPRQGEEMKWEGLHFKVLQMEGNRIDKLLVKRI